MPQLRFSEREDVFSRQYQYEDSAVMAVDLGPAAGEASVDVLDDAVIVVVDDGEEARQLEFELPAGDAEAFITNGVLTIEVRR